VEPDRRTIFVISGGQLILTGSPTVPIPRDTYMEVFPLRYFPQTYVEARAAGVTIVLPIVASTIWPPCVWPLSMRSMFCPAACGRKYGR